MRLADIPALLVEDKVRKWRRRAIAFAIVAFCAIIVLIEGFSAARAALAISFGPVYGHLMLAGIFGALLLLVLAVLWLLERRDAGVSKESIARDQRVTLIAEAIDLGYTLARELKQPATSTSPQDPPPAEEPGIGQPETPPPPRTRRSKAGQNESAG